MSFEDMIFEEMNGHTVEEDGRYIRGYNQGRLDERAKVIEEINVVLKNMYLEISNTVNGNDYTSKNDLVTVVASKCRQYISKELEQLKEQNNE